MKIILISGERGTGKTTISKRVAEGLNYRHYSDYDVLTNLEIIHDGQNGDDGKTVILNAYRKFFNSHKNENIVLDCETTILPERIILLQKEFDIDAIFLGFEGIAEDELFNRLKSKKNNLSDIELKIYTHNLLDLGRRLKKLCVESGIRFVAINKNRKAVIDELCAEYIEKYKSLT